MVYSNDIFILCFRPGFFNLHFTTRKPSTVLAYIYTGKIPMEALFKKSHKYFLISYTENLVKVTISSFPNRSTSAGSAWWLVMRSPTVSMIKGSSLTSRGTSISGGTSSAPTASGTRRSASSVRSVINQFTSGFYAIVWMVVDVWEYEIIPFDSP